MGAHPCFGHQGAGEATCSQMTCDCCHPDAETCAAWRRRHFEIIARWTTVPALQMRSLEKAREIEGPCDCACHGGERGRWAWHSDEMEESDGGH